jgi:hypothetical protein
MSHYEAGREAAFERKIEALRRESAREHDVHEHALAADRRSTHGGCLRCSTHGTGRRS